MKIYNFNNKRRLKSKKEINTVFKSINFVKGFYYIIKYIPNNFNFDRIGIMIKKKILMQLEEIMKRGY